MRKVIVLLILFTINLAVVAYAAPTTPVRVALVLGSGGARGYAHVGVIKVLEKAGIPIDLIVGASAGSIIGGVYADSADAAKLEKIMLSSNMRSFVDINLLPAHGGLITGIQEQQFLQENLRSRNFNDLKIAFATVATDLTTGAPVVLKQGSVIAAIRASTALPGLVRPVVLNGLTLVDGGAVEPLPVQIAASYHPQVIIAVDVNQPLSAQMPSTAYGIYTRTQNIIWQRLTAYSGAGADIIIQPQVGSAGVFALNQRAQLMKCGEQAAQASLPAIFQLLKRRHIVWQDAKTTPAKK
jgi:NTE family protein